MTAPDLELSDAECDAIAREVWEAQRDQTGGGDWRRRAFKRALIRAGAAARADEKTWKQRYAKLANSTCACRLGDSEETFAVECAYHAALRPAARAVPWSERLSRALNGLDIDEWDKRAEHIMQSQLDGLMIGPNNRNSVKATLAEHFADIAARAVPRGEPVAWRCPVGDNYVYCDEEDQLSGGDWEALYAAPERAAREEGK